MLYGIIIALAAGADQTLKWWIEQQDPKDFPRPLEKTGGKIWLYRNHNAGFPFGFLQKHTELVRILPLIVTSMLGGILCCLTAERRKPVHKMALAVVIGGSISNLYDRYVRRYVVDYFSPQLGFLKKAVFNLGDVCVFAGSGILVFLSLIHEIQKSVREVRIAGKTMGKQ